MNTLGNPNVYTNLDASSSPPPPVAAKGIDPIRTAQQMQEQLDQAAQLVDDEVSADSRKRPFVLPKNFLLSVVIPVYNEERTIEQLLRQVAAISLPKEIVVIDDCSQDGTLQILRRLQNELGLRVITKANNEGKGAALQDGFQSARGDVVVVQDADLEYDPSDIPHLLKPILEGCAEVVYGSRFLHEAPQDPSLTHRFGNRMLTAASNLFTGLELTDMETCYKAFRRSVLEEFDLDQKRFGFEPEITAKLARRGCRFVEVPIRYHARSYKEGKKIGVKDGFNALFCIVRYGLWE
jgi:glycosyltransferase involved in cell wall biosynthesis